MKKFAKIAMLASALVMPSLAHAAPVDGTYSGEVTVTKGITLVCNMTVDVSGGGTSASNISLSPASWLYALCSSVNFNSQPYTVAAVPNQTNKYEIQNVNVTTITPGNCAGNIQVTYVPGGPAIDLNGTLPADSSGSDCTVNGLLELE